MAMTLTSKFGLAATVLFVGMSSMKMYFAHTTSPCAVAEAKEQKADKACLRATIKLGNALQDPDSNRQDIEDAQNYMSDLCAN